MTDIKKAFRHQANRYVIGGAGYFRYTCMFAQILLPVANWRHFDEDGLEKFVESLKKGDDFTLRRMIGERSAYLGIRDEHQATLLHFSVRQQHYDCVQLLLEKGLDPNKPDMHGEAPLDYMGEEQLNDPKMAERFPEIVFRRNKIQELLRSYGAKHTKPTGLARRADHDKLFNDILGGELEGIRQFAGAFGIENALFAGTFCNALSLAVCMEKPDVVKLLLDSGADPNIRNWDMETPVFDALRQADTNLLSLLIDRGADINAADIYGSTPLMQAARDKNVEKLKILLQKNADLGSADLDGNTAFSIAVKFGHRDIAGLLAAAAIARGTAGETKPAPRINLKKPPAP